MKKKEKNSENGSQKIVFCLPQGFWNFIPISSAITGGNVLCFSPTSGSAQGCVWSPSHMRTGSRGKNRWKINNQLATGTTSRFTATANLKEKLPAYCQCKSSVCIPHACILILFISRKHLCHHKQHVSFGDRQQSINIHQLFVNSSLIFFWFQSAWSLTCWRWRGVFRRRAPGPCCWGSSGADRTADRTLFPSAPYPGNFPTLPVCTEKHIFHTAHTHTQLMEHFWPRKHTEEMKHKSIGCAWPHIVERNCKNRLVFHFSEPRHINTIFLLTQLEALFSLYTLRHCTAGPSGQACLIFCCCLCFSRLTRQRYTR